MRIVLDTNVLVSSLLSEGPPSRILNLIRSKEIRVLVDERILAEYEEVLGRPRFGLSDQVIRQIVGFLSFYGERITAPPQSIKIRDPDDLPFLEVAITGAADILVTGNKKDFLGSSKKLRILSPSEALREFAN